MEFTKFHEGIECDCIDGAQQNCIDVFARRISGEKIKEKCFKSGSKHFATDFVDCASACSKRATSIDIWNDESKRFITQKSSLGIAPGFRPMLMIFKIKQDGALVKPTPNENNPFHHDLYWKDEFKVNECFEIINTIKIAYDAV